MRFLLEDLSTGEKFYLNDLLDRPFGFCVLGKTGDIKPINCDGLVKDHHALLGYTPNYNSVSFRVIGRAKAVISRGKSEISIPYDGFQCGFDSVDLHSGDRIALGADLSNKSKKDAPAYRFRIEE